jgi:DNA-3-methyladenine glycosylase
LARRLIGAILVRDTSEGCVSGRIVETEAYLAKGDASSHSFRGPTARNASMYLERGHAYVYMTYGLHFCLNVSSLAAGAGEAVLIRALEPLEGLPLMAARRGLAPGAPPAVLTSGPARLTQALAVDRSLDGIDLCAGGPLRLARDRARRLSRDAIGVSVRIGISAAAGLPLRFYLRGSRFISGPRWLSP